MNWRCGKRSRDRELAAHLASIESFNNISLNINVMVQSLHDSFGLIGEAITAASASIGRIKPRAAKPDFPVTPTEMK